MIVTQLRSSAVGSWLLCGHQYFLQYNLSLPFFCGRAASLGNASHKALELLALRKVAEQNGETAFEADDIGLIENNKLTVAKAAQLGFEYYRRVDKHINWQEDDYKIIKQYVTNMVEYGDGMYNPLQQQVVAVEQFFDWEMPGPQFHYKYELPDMTLEGQLHLKGTLDLVVELDTNTIGIIDIKTGGLKKFPLQREKTTKDFLEDHQFLMYYYMARKLYPQYKYCDFTIFYAQFNKPVTIPFEDKHIKIAEDFILKQFNDIRKTTKPQLKPGWYCQYCCTAYKPFEDTGMSMCQYFKKEVQQKGADAVFIERDAVKMLGNYGSGGGRTEKQ